MNDIRSIHLTLSTGAFRQIWPRNDTPVIRPDSESTVPPWLALALLTLATRECGRTGIRWSGRPGAFVGWCLHEVGATARRTRLRYVRLGAIVRAGDAALGFALGVCRDEVYLIGADDRRVSVSACAVARVSGYDWPGAPG